MKKWLVATSIQSRLAKLLGLAIGVTAVVAVIIWNLEIEPALRLGLVEKQQEIVRRASEQIDHFLGQRLSELRTGVKFGLLAGDSAARQKDGLLRLLQATPHILSLTIIDSRGHPHLTAVADPVIPVLESYRSTLIFTKGRQGLEHISEVLHSSRGEPFVTIGIPLLNSKTEIDAVLAAEVSLASLWNSISSIRVGKSGQLYIVSQGGILIAHRDPSKVSLYLNLANLGVVSRFISRDSTTSLETVLGEDGKLGLGSYSIVSKTGWGVVAEEPVETALAPIIRVKWLAGAWLLFAIIGVFVLSHRFSLRITNPIRLLEKGTQLISRGQLNHSIDLHSGDEVQSLAENFNRMAGALKASYDDLEAKIAERTKDISALYVALAPVKPNRSLDEMLGGVMERLLEATGADAALLRLQSSDDDASECIIGRGLDPNYLLPDARERLTPVMETVYKRGVAVISADIATDFRFQRKVALAAGVRSCALLPLTVSGKIRGMIQIASRKPGHFKPEKQEHFVAIARQMSVTIENHELFFETERHRRESEILYTITDAVRRSLDIAILARTALATALEKFAFDAGRVYLIDSDGCALRLAAHEGLPETDLDAVSTYSPGEGLIGRIFADNQPVVFSDGENSPEYAELALPREKLMGEFRCEIGFPIRIKNQAVGVFYLHHRNARKLTAADINLLLHIGKQVGSAVENAWLYERAQRSLERIRALHEIDIAITSSVDLESVLAVLLEKVEVFLLHKGICLIHLNNDTGALEPVACHDLAQQYSQEAHHGGYDRIPQLVADARSSVTVPNLRADSRTKELLRFDAEVFTSYLGVPLFVRGELLGVLSYFTAHEHAFTNQEIEFLMTLGGQGAIAIHKAQLYEEIKKQTEQLENSNRIKDDFLCVISHELKTPLLAVDGYTSLLSDGVLGSLTSEQQKAVGVIERNCRDLLRMVHSILEATKLQNRTVTIQSEDVNIGGLFEELAQSYDIPRDKPVKICWDYDHALPPLSTDRDKLKHILQNLVDNALKFTEEGRVGIAAAYRSEREEMEFKVSDTGIGIPDDQLPLIYDKFRQVDGSVNRGYEGAGLGLFIVKEFIDLLGGNVHVDSKTGKGSTFTVTLPCAFTHPSITAVGEASSGCDSLAGS